MKPLAIDLFCGLGGWAEGFLAGGYEVIGFDIERHDYGTGGYPGQLVIQDVLTLYGSQFRNATCIVASPPCQAYSYRAMPWSRAKALPPPDNTLFDACFRIQREACEAAGRHIPLVVENVRGAQKWVGRAKWHFGSYYLWGDLPALMPIAMMRAQKANPDGTAHPAGSWFAIADSKNRGSRSEAVKVSGLNFSDYGKPGYKAGAFNDTAVKQLRENGSKGIPHRTAGHWTNPAEHHNGIKSRELTSGQKQGLSQGAKFWPGDITRTFGSKSSSRKAASALIAKIPFALANHIAKCFHAHSELYGLGTQKDLSQSQDV